MSASVSYQLNEGVATITLDDGKANVMSVQMLGAIDGALDRALQDKAAVIVQGRQGMFSAGFDLTVFKSDPRELLEMLTSGAKLTERVLSFPYPVIAVCTGHAIAMGAFLLLSADLRIGTMANAKVQVNEVQIGFTLPHFAIEVCRQRLLPTHFNLAALTARPYSQSQAVEAGFLDELTTPDELAGVLEAHKSHLRTLDRDAFTATKMRLRESGLALLREAIGKDLEAWSMMFRDGD